MTTLELLEERWEHLVSNQALEVDQLPEAGSPWHEIVWFAGSFNGYQLQPNIRHADAALTEVREHFEATGSLPELGLTSARAMLFFCQRSDHFGGGYDSGVGLRLAQALVAEIRQLVMARENTLRSSSDATITVGEIEDRVMDAFERLVVDYARWGGHRFHGWTDYPDTHNYLGPVIQSEADCVLRLALHLESEWPACVHAELPVSKANFANFEPSTERQQRVDLAVSDLSEFVEDNTSQDRYRNMRHEAFFEVKWLKKGWLGEKFEHDAHKRVLDVNVDAAKLANHLQLNRCALAATFVVDDEDFFSEHGDVDTWPAGVWRLVLGPNTLRRYGLLDR